MDSGKFAKPQITLLLIICVRVTVSYRLMKGLMLSPVIGAMLMGMGCGVDSQKE